MKHIHPHRRCIAVKIRGGQARATIKGITLYARNVFRYGYAGQTRAAGKRITPNDRNAGRQGNAGQAGAAGKRIDPNGRYASRYGESACFAAGALQQCGLALVVQHAIQTAVAGVIRRNFYTGHTAAAQKRPVAYAGYAGRDGHCRNAGLIFKRIICNAGYRHAIYRRWNCNCSAGTGVADDGDCTV